MTVSRDQIFSHFCGFTFHHQIRKVCRKQSAPTTVASLFLFFFSLLTPCFFPTMKKTNTSFLKNRQTFFLKKHFPPRLSAPTDYLISSREHKERKIHSFLTIYSKFYLTFFISSLCVPTLKFYKNFSVYSVSMTISSFSSSKCIT